MIDFSDVLQNGTLEQVRAWINEKRRKTLSGHHLVDVVMAQRLDVLRYLDTNQPAVFSVLKTDALFTFTSLFKAKQCPSDDIFNFILDRTSPEMLNAVLPEAWSGESSMPVWVMVINAVSDFSLIDARLRRLVAAGADFEAIEFLQPAQRMALHPHQVKQLRAAANAVMLHQPSPPRARTRL